MRPLFDTIVAPITGLHRAAVAIVRLSGPDAWEVAAQVFRPWPDPVRPRHALFGRLIHGDEGLALPFETGHSYTGEATVELSIHGSPASVLALIEACRRAGARDALPGEFTERAFLNGRLDLIQAEAVRDTIEAQTATQLRRAEHLRSGHLCREIARLRAELLSVLAAIEASVDFSEEIGEFDRPRGVSQLSAVRDLLAGLLATSESGRLVRDGLTIALVGRPNAGKSSLLNALLRTDRAIVTSIPGTTRDTLEEAAEIGGLLVRLVDTAGMRETEDVVEREGVRRSLRAMAQADRVWHLVDASVGWTPEDEAIGPSDLVVWTKADLGSGPGLSVSVMTGQGIDALENWVREQAPDAETSIPPRAGPELAIAIEGLDLAIGTLGQELPPDLGTVGLRHAMDALGRVTGETANADLLETLFRTFCIGK